MPSPFASVAVARTACRGRTTLWKSNRACVTTAHPARVIAAADVRTCDEMPPARDNDHSALALFAAELQAARARAGMSRDELAARINYSPSLVGMVESMRRVPRLDFAQRCDEALATTGTFARLHEHLRTAPFPSWFRPFAQHEAEATSLRTFQLVLVPGLLQTARLCPCAAEDPGRCHRGRGRPVGGRSPGAPGHPGPRRPAAAVGRDRRGRGAPSGRRRRGDAGTRSSTWPRWPGGPAS